MKIIKVIHPPIYQPVTFTMELSKEEADYLQLVVRGHTSTSETRRQQLSKELEAGFNGDRS